MTLNTVKDAKETLSMVPGRTLAEKALTLRLRRERLARQNLEPVPRIAQMGRYFSTYPDAVKHGYLWTPKPGVYECPRCPGKLIPDRANDELTCRGRHVKVYLAPFEPVPGAPEMGGC